MASNTTATCRTLRALWLLACTGCILHLLPSAASASEPAGVRTAFYYGADLPAGLVDHYDRVVVDPDNVGSPASAPQGRAQLLAYVSLGEIGPARSYRSEVPHAWLLGDNRAFGSAVVDVRRPEWTDFVVTRVIDPLWRRGYRGFFLDTLDSYALHLESPAERSAAKRQLARLIQRIEQRHPTVTLVANRGFELLPSIASCLDGIAAESLFRGYDAAKQRYTLVSESDRQWLTARLTEARDEHHLPVVVIDYLPENATAQRRTTARAIAALGFMPWVATPSLDDFGVGAVEVISRDVLLIHDQQPDGDGVTPGRQLLAPALEALGYVLQERPISERLPPPGAMHRYAGVIAWVQRVPAAQRAAWRSWLRAQRHAGVRVAFIESFGGKPDAAYLRSLGLTKLKVPVSPHRVVSQAPWIGFESGPPLRNRDELAYRGDGVVARSMLRIADSRAKAADAVVVGGWGGIAFSPFVLVDGPEGTYRWVFDPIAYLRAALDLPSIPAPDVTTESGRRVLTTVLGGDGIDAPSELRAGASAGQVIVESLLEREELPVTVCLDLAAPSAAVDKVVKGMRALAHVEMAGSSVVVLNDRSSVGTAPDAAAIVLGAPRGWPRVPEHGSMTMMQPLGVPLRGTFAALVPGASDIQYTGGFVAPFDRYRRAIETFALEDGPRRLRPIGIRYSFLSGTKRASLRAVREVHAAVRSQEVFPLWLSEYAARVRGFGDATVARHLDGSWEVARLGDARTLRLEAGSGWPDLARSVGVAGARALCQGTYVHLTGSRVRLVVGPSPPQRPFLAHSNARVTRWRWEDGRVRVALHGHMPVELVVHAERGGQCRLQVRGRSFAGHKTPSGIRFSLPWSEIGDAALFCVT
ncbi:MAG: endo alpha-1,4 polygalactosaminidase [Myxococcota bacterium]